MSILSRLIRLKIFKSGTCLNATVKILLALCVAYIVFRPFISGHDSHRIPNGYGASPSNVTGWSFEDVHVGVTKLTGFLNALKVESEHEVVHIVPAVSVGERIPNCGLSSRCPQNAFSIHVFTGKDHHDEPRLCIDGKYILGNGLNGGGRGINVAVIDNFTRFVQRVSHFDTYEEDSSQLETLLLNLRVGDIVILLTFDEPTRKLSQVARLLLHELGSAMAQNLHYRSSWYLVTQKGISGFSPYEDMS